MKPASIRRFDLFFLASLALLAVGFFIGFDATVESIRAQTAAQGLQVGGGFAIGLFAVVLVINLLLWFLVSRKGVSVAKWLLVVLLIIDLFGVPSLLGGGLTASKMVSLLRIALEAVAIAFLFKADAKAWFGGTPADEGEGDTGPAA
jgi:hypothetical protein